MADIVFFAGIPGYQAKSMEVCAEALIAHLRARGLTVQRCELRLGSRWPRLRRNPLLEFVLRYLAYPALAWGRGRIHGSKPLYYLVDHANSFLLCWLPRRARKVVQVHDLTSIRPVRDLPFPTTFRNHIIHLLAILLKKPGILRAEQVVTDSEFAKRDIVRYLGIPKASIHPVPLGVDHDLFHPGPMREARARLGLPEGVPLIMTLTDGTPRKNLMAVLEAVSVLRRRWKDLRLLVVGPFDRASRRMLGDPALAGCVEQRQGLAAADLARCYRACDVFIFPSLFDGFGLPPLEAMACARPVVAARATSLPEVVGDAGLFFSPGRIDELVRQLDLLLRDPHFARRLAAAGHARSKRFTWDETAWRLAASLGLCPPQERDGGKTARGNAPPRVRPRRAMAMNRRWIL